MKTSAALFVITALMGCVREPEIGPALSGIDEVHTQTTTVEVVANSVADIARIIEDETAAIIEASSSALRAASIDDTGNLLRIDIGAVYAASENVRNEIAGLRAEATRLRQANNRMRSALRDTKAMLEHEVRRIDRLGRMSAVVRSRTTRIIVGIALLICGLAIAGTLAHAYRNPDIWDY